MNHAFLKWLLSYLSSHSFCVRVNDKFGETVPLPSGVPQGSVLGPYLFAAFMGCVSFDDFSSIHAIQYADDVTLVETIRYDCQDTISFCEIDTKSLNAGLCLNRNKCKDIVISRSPSISIPIDPSITRVNTLRILGVTFMDTFVVCSSF